MMTNEQKVKLEFLRRAQKILSKAKQLGRICGSCCCDMSRSEKDHHLWIRSTDDVEMRKGMYNRAAGYFDLSLVPLCSPKRLAIRLWTEDGGAGVNAKLKGLFSEGVDMCGRKGLVCAHSKNLHKQPKCGESNDPHGLFDFYRPEFKDWPTLNDEQLATVIDDYLAIEGVISKSKLW